MPLPLSVKTVLNQLEIACEPVAQSPATFLCGRANATEPFAILTLLSSDAGVSQAIFSGHSLLNLEAVSPLGGHAVTALKADDCQRYLDKAGVKRMPAIPQLTGKTTLVDHSLLNASRVLLEDGLGECLAISGDDFKRLVADCQVANIALPVSDLEVNDDHPELDIENIHSAIRNYTTLRIQQELSDTLEIPPLSETARKVIAISSDPNADAEDLVKVVELDPGLAAQIVGWAGSPYYSAPGKVTSTQDAIVRVLGFDLVLNLALGLSVGKSLRLPDDNPDNITPYWLQSVYCALSMEKLNRLVIKKGGASGLAYLAGLLNNFGYLILAHVFPDYFSATCRYLEANPHLNYRYIEQHLLGVTRDQINAAVLASWHLPPAVTDAIRFQNSPQHAGPGKLYAQLSTIATQLLAERGIGGDRPACIDPHLLEGLDVSLAEVTEVIDDVVENHNEVELIAGFLGA